MQLMAIYYLFKQVTIHGSSPGVRAGHATVNIGTKASHDTNLFLVRNFFESDHIDKFQKVPIFR